MHDTHADEGSTEAVGGGEAVKPLVLVVDDDATVRSMADYHLGELGYRVESLADGREFLQTFQMMSPDVVLLDVMLPDTDGFSLCRALRAVPGAEHVPVVMLTSLGDEKAVRMAFDAGATQFVQKPVNWVNEAYRLRYLLRAAATTRDLEAAHEAVSRAKSEWEQTFASIDDPVMLLSPELTIRRANRAAARLARRPLEEVIGKPCHEVLACRQAGQETCWASRALVSRVPERGELNECGPGKRSCLASAAPVFNGGERPIAVVYSLKDVTEYRELEREFLHAQKMEALGVLAAGIAHDFNNLLQGIMGFAELLAEEGQTKLEIGHGLEEIRAMATKGQGLTRQLLLSSRKASAPFGPVDVGAMLRETADVLKRTIPKTVTTEVAIGAELWQVTGEGSHLQQAVMNLAINAAQSMPEGGTLCIRAENTILDKAYCDSHHDCHAGPHVLLAVSDTGYGMDADTMQKMYEPFFTTKEPDKGTGLGLSVVYGIAQNHGGHICCYSELGKGTTFKMYIPMCSMKAPSQAIAEPANHASISGDGRCVLLVEDEPMLQKLNERILKGSGFRVILADNGLDALNQYDAVGDDIDVIVMDMNMPCMNGETCLEELAARECKAPVILATGALIGAERRAKLLRHAHEILMKPFNGKALVRAVSQALVECVESS